MPDTHDLTLETIALRSVPPSVECIATCSCLRWSATVTGANRAEAERAAREAWNPHKLAAGEAEGADYAKLSGSEAILEAGRQLEQHPLLGGLPIATGHALRELLESQHWTARVTEQAVGPLLKVTGGEVSYAGAAGSAVTLARLLLSEVPRG